MKGIRVTIEDLENPDTEPEVVTVVDNYLLLTQGTCEVKYEQHYPTAGKAVLSIAGIGGTRDV